jgi:hypothetical protein
MTGTHKQLAASYLQDLQQLMIRAQQALTRIEQLMIRAQQALTRIEHHLALEAVSVEIQILLCRLLVVFEDHAGHPFWQATRTCSHSPVAVPVTLELRT